MAISADDFWRASLHIYQQDGVQDRLLVLQDEQGLNVNLELLRILLSGDDPAAVAVASPAFGKPLSDAEYRQLQTRVMRFSRTYTCQVRALRRQLTDPQHYPQGQQPLNEKSRKQLKSQLLAAELELEKEEQLLLLRSLSALRQTPGSD